MTTRRVSVVVPAHNAERYLGEALSSIFAQAVRPLEVIVVDDGSTDGTAEIAAAYEPQVRVIRQTNRGAGAARNAGIDAASGDLIAFLDADDLWTSGRLSTQLEAADSADVDLVFGHVEHFVSPELDEAEATRIFCPEGSAPGHLIGCMLGRAGTIRDVGPLREDLRVGEFLDWMSRCEDFGVRVSMVSETVLRRRLHSTNLGIRERAASGDYAVVLKAMLDRRRGR